MPLYILKLGDDEYVDWSTIVDAPTSYIVSRADAIRLGWGEDRLARADAYTTSLIEPIYGPDCAEAAIAGNRAGADESELTLAQIRALYRLEAP